MSIFSIFLSALTLVPTNESDTIQTERLDEVVVVSNSARQRVQSVQTGAEQLKIKELTATPQLLWEDIIKDIQLMAGVKAESDASSGFQVRGGTSAQNQILLDGTPVYNAGHLGGLFSAFNVDALATATLYKGLQPAQYGSASSAVLDLVGKTGNKSEYHGKATVGFTAFGGEFEGPIVKDKVGFLIAARRSYMDWLLKLSKDFSGNTLYFYDLNAKIDWTINSKNQLFLTFFSGKDETGLDKMVDLKWNNLSASLKWLHYFNDNSYSQSNIYYSGYGTDDGTDLLGMNLWFAGHIRQTGFKQDLHLGLGNYKIDAGLQTALMNVKSAEWKKVTLEEKEQRKAWDNAIWANLIFPLAKNVHVSAGLRLTAFMPLGGSLYYDYPNNRVIKTYLNLEPRLSLKWQTSDLTSIKLGYTRTTQNVHALRNQSTSTPFDRYTMSSNIIEPEVADQVSGGFFLMTPSQMYDFSIEGYYRHINHALDYRDGKTFSSEIEIERLILPGEGKGYGVELTARKNGGKLTGWMNYTLSWSKTRIDEVNGGRWYNANNDRRHDINIVAMYRLNKRWTLSAAWVFNTGQAFTAPSAKYQIEGNWIFYYTERNGYRAPDYHHLDVGAVWRKQNKHTTIEWDFSIYNLYNHYNPYLINFEDRSKTGTSAVQYSLFGIVPSVAFKIEF